MCEHSFYFLLSAYLRDFDPAQDLPFVYLVQPCISQSLGRSPEEIPLCVEDGAGGIVDHIVVVRCKIECRGGRSFHGVGGQISDNVKEGLVVTISGKERSERSVRPIQFPCIGTGGNPKSGRSIQNAVRQQSLARVRHALQKVGRFHPQCGGKESTSVLQCNTATDFGDLQGWDGPTHQQTGPRIEAGKVRSPVARQGVVVQWIRFGVDVRKEATHGYGSDLAKQSHDQLSLKHPVFRRVRQVVSHVKRSILPGDSDFEEHSVGYLSLGRVDVADGLCCR